MTPTKTILAKSIVISCALLLILFSACNKKENLKDPLAVTKTLNSKQTTNPPPDSLWEPFIGNNLEVRALPDFYSNYFSFAFDRRQGENQYIGIRVKGQFGYARYMSYNVYDVKKGTSYGAATDTSIIPDPGSINPFKSNADPNAPNRNYTLTVVPDGYRAYNNETNVFTYISDSINVISLMIRYYVPQISATANVPLPTVETFDVRTGNPVPIPPTFSIEQNGPPKIAYTHRLAPIWQTAIDDTVRFYYNSGAGQFNNQDNKYLISGLKRFGNEVFLIRFKAPTFRHDGSTDPNEDVRYWSINEGKYNTTTPFGKKDADIKTAADGYVYVAIGDNDIKAKAAEAGYNFMPWSVKEPIMALVYRNMLSSPSYPGYIGKVPSLDLSNRQTKMQNIYDQNARLFIGDYAPQGIKMSRSAFMSNYGGWPAPGF